MDKEIRLKNGNRYVVKNGVAIPVQESMSPDKQSDLDVGKNIATAILILVIGFFLVVCLVGPYLAGI